MEAYTDFAEVYDLLMDNTPYEAWRDRIIAAIERFGISKPRRGSEDPLESERNLVLDLGCGTGTLAEMLYAKGYDVIGVDASPEMLAQAMQKQSETGSEILYLCQDMRELDLYSTVGAVISVCDALNYLLNPKDLKQTLALVYNYLYPGGLFLFDVNTDYLYREKIGNRTIAENRENCSFIWENRFDAKDGTNEYDLTFFVREGEGELFRRFEETHFQRGYGAEEVRAMLEEIGFSVLALTDSDTGEEPAERTQRLFVIAKCVKGSMDG